MSENKNTCLQALENLRGDDLYRARCAFRGMTEKQMQEQHGETGKTRQQILDDYDAHDRRVRAAILWVKGVRE